MKQNWVSVSGPDDENRENLCCFDTYLETCCHLKLLFARADLLVLHNVNLVFQHNRQKFWKKTAPTGSIMVSIFLEVEKLLFFVVFPF